MNWRLWRREKGTTVIYYNPEKMMRPKEIKKLIELVEQSNINELEVSRWGKKVRILKSANKTGNITVVPESNTSSSSSPIQSVKEVTLPTEAAAPAKVEPTASATEPALDNIIEVKSPMVGTFYRAPAPDADPYVQVGEIVSPNQVLRCAGCTFQRSATPPHPPNRPTP